MRITSVLGMVLFLWLPAAAETWRAMGPPGGDVRSFGFDPHRPSQLYLGTADGHIFISRDAGEQWELLGRVGSRFDAVITAILVDSRDSRVLYASTWKQDPAAGGGVYRSEDGGRTWSISGLADQAVRALVQSSSDPDRLVAGTLEGVFASQDAGRTWQRVSPASNTELRNIDSLAVDPRRPDVIYAGTFHLPWKSTDGGESWKSIHRGMIDDSDVMSILVDRSDPERIYASSCSGIYRTENGGGLWTKIHGIPYSARRTHVIAQDPAHPGMIYAGTTEGLWKSQNGGASWRRMTPADWVINAVALPADHPGRVVLGTERLGVVVSDDGGEHFREANDGFDHRRIVAVAFDPEHRGRILVVLAHAPEPILVTEDGGQSWTPLGPGLAMRSLKQIFASPDGWWAAVAEGGLMRYDAWRKKAWVRVGTLRAGAEGKRLSAGRKRELKFVVNDMAFSETSWFAATEQGLLVSADRGVHWDRLPLGLLPDLPVASVRASRDARSLWVVSLRGLVFSTDEGHTWTWHDLPLSAGGALHLKLAPGRWEGQILVASARNGLYISRDGGDTWQQAAAGLPGVAVEDIAIVGEMFVASPRVGGLYVSVDTGRTWSRITGSLAEGIFPAIAADVDTPVILAASATDGLYAIEFGPSESISASEFLGPQAPLVPNRDK